MRLIERWLPMAALSEECSRERRSMTALPPIYYLHVWWARRPLVASRAAVLASILPADADRERFMRAIGIHGDPVAARNAMEAAKRSGKRIPNPYSYDRAFKYSLDPADRQWLLDSTLETHDSGGPQRIRVLDPTAGGGSIPFEGSRLGLSTLANDLNPVAALVMSGTLDWPRLGPPLMKQVEEISRTWRQLLEDRLSSLFSQEGAPDRFDMTYLWARTITCPSCEGLVPLSPNWRLASGGTGVRLKPYQRGGPGSLRRLCEFEIVESASQQSEGTVLKGAGLCPFSDCGRVIDGDEIKRQAHAGKMGEQLFAVVFKKRVEYVTKTGKRGWKWERGFRAPRPDDDNSAEIAALLADKMPEWEAFDYVPSERFPDVCNDDRPIQYGMPFWRDLFSPPSVAMPRYERRGVPRDARRGPAGRVGWTMCARQHTAIWR